MEQKLFSQQFELCFKSIFYNTLDITHEESLQWPAQGGNCLNWVFGHILLSRKEVIDLVHRPDQLNLNLECYRRGMDPKEKQSDFLKITQLKVLLEETQGSILKGLSGSKKLSNEELSEIAGLAFHEAYHAGQIGLLRRLIGKEGQIK